MPIVAQGGDITLTALVAHANGQPADDPALTLKIVDAVGGTVAGFPVAVPPIVRVSIGNYTYTWSVPSGLAIGDYTAQWAAVVDSGPASGYEPVQVVPVGSIGTTAYCSLADVKGRLAGDVPNMGTEYDAMLTAKCLEVTRDIDRMVAQARGIRGPWSFLADAVATARLFTGKRGGVRYLPIDDCVSVASVVEIGRTLVVGTDYLVDPMQGTPVVGLIRLNGVWSETPGSISVVARWGYGTAVAVDVRETAAIEVIRSYRADQAGNSDVVGVSPFGTAQTTKAWSSKLMQLVNDYSYGGGYLR